MKALLHGDSWLTDYQPTGQHSVKILSIQTIGKQSAYVQVRFKIGIVRGFIVDSRQFPIDVKRLKKGNWLTLRIRRATVDSRLMSVIRGIEKQ